MHSFNLLNIKNIAAIMILLALAACGGGGGSSNNSVSDTACVLGSSNIGDCTI